MYVVRNVYIYKVYLTLCEILKRAFIEDVSRGFSNHLTGIFGRLWMGRVEKSCATA